MPKNYHLFLKGTVGHWNFSSEMVGYVLDKYRDETVKVLIDSLGGDVATALSISALFANHGDVHCHYVGMSASAATIASMGAKCVSIDSAALYLVHQCQSPVVEWDYMNADELAAHIAELEKTKQDNETIDGCIAGLYARRCKKSKEDLLALMKKGAWLTAEEALAWGFVDEITNNNDDKKPVLTGTVAAAIADAGIPMPPVVVKNRSILDFFTSLFSGFQPTTDTNAPATCTQAINADKYPELTKVVPEQIMQTVDGVSISEASANAVEQELAKRLSETLDLTAQLESKRSEIEKLTAEISALKQEPADTTAVVIPVNEPTVDREKLVDALLNILP